METKPYYAQYPAPYQQRRYLIQGAIPQGSRFSERATLFVSSLGAVSALIS